MLQKERRGKPPGQRSTSFEVCSYFPLVSRCGVEHSEDSQTKSKTLGLVQRGHSSEKAERECRLPALTARRIDQAGLLHQ